jgi:hypothetical protein
MTEFYHRPFLVTEVPFIPVKELNLIQLESTKAFTLTITSEHSKELGIKVSSKTNQRSYKCPLRGRIFYTEVDGDSPLVISGTIGGEKVGDPHKLKGKCYQITCLPIDLIIDDEMEEII